MTNHLVALPSALMLAACVSPSLAATISPGSASVQVGHGAFVAVQIRDISDLYAFQFDLSFDTALLQLQNITEGEFLRTGGASVFLPGAIDNPAGIAMATAGSLVGPVPGVTGDGPLARFRFRGLSEGTSPLVLSNVVLLDSALNDIGFSANEGLIVVSLTPVPVPEPGTLALVGASVLALYLAARRRARYASSGKRA